jgi:multidrug efflux pump
MVLSDLSIQRPVLATVMSLMVVLLGIMAYERLPVREYPNIDTPVVSVRTAYRGASSEVIAREPADLAERFRSPQSRREWAQKR